MEPTTSCPFTQGHHIPLGSESSSEIVGVLQSSLHACQVINETGKLFIPDGTLEHILDEHTVRVLLQLVISRSERSINTQEYAEKICNQKHPFRKILAILLLTNVPSAIETFVKLSIDDLILPMQDPRQLLSREHSRPSDYDADTTKIWECLTNSGLSSDFLITIYERQWCVLAPHFGKQDDIPHYKLTKDHILPFLQKTVQSPSHSELYQSLDKSVLYGSFSQVRQVNIHPNHHNFGDYGINNPHNHFAVKTLRTNDYNDFSQEIKIFQRHRKSQIHIVSLLATYEIKETEFDDRHNTYCLIFPWAEGDLRSFWEMNENLVQDQKLLPWIARECYEIIRALSYIHGDTHEQTTSTDSFGRHGDVKPSNILWYPDSSLTNSSDFGKLVLADFGLADFHRASSKSVSSVSSLPMSVTYRAPESDTSGIISRKIDIWALGCTFLEFVTWFLEGLNAVQEEFPEHRSEVDMYGVFADTFFIIRQHKGHQEALLKPQVVDWIIRLRNDRFCSQYLSDFLNIIQHDMLVVERSKRKSADKISGKLEILYSRCSDHVGYLQPIKLASSGPKEETKRTGEIPGSFLGNIFHRHSGRASDR